MLSVSIATRPKNFAAPRLKKVRGVLLTPSCGEEYCFMGGKKIERVMLLIFLPLNLFAISILCASVWSLASDWHTESLSRRDSVCTATKGHKDHRNDYCFCVLCVLCDLLWLTNESAWIQDRREQPSLVQSRWRGHLRTRVTDQRSKSYAESADLRFE